ncbi:MAG: acetyl-CoA carboxylase biotin carboxyl carrier protein subunit [Bacteroidia bacterium]|nr:acetyl-CoA carboxylase biotin carboxyl carrier protein subunit [Bacteroidia bacterium]
MHKAIINGKTFEIEQKQGQFTLNGQPVLMDWKPLRENVYHLILNHQSYTIELLEADAALKTLALMVNGRKTEVQLKDAFDQLLSQLGFDLAAANKVNDVKAPMPGLVLNIFVEPGQAIKKGDSLLVLEAMKMENVLKSPGDGTVTKVMVKAKDKVEKNQVLLHLN